MTTGTNVEGEEILKPEVLNLDNPSRQCSSLAFPGYPMTGSTGKLMMFEGYFPFICGSEGETEPVMNKCYRHGDGKPFSGMIHGRKHAASVRHLDGEHLWITGGFDPLSRPFNSTEYVSVIGRYVSEANSFKGSIRGPDMPVATGYHCMTLVNDTTAIILGGSDGHSVWFFDFETESFSRGPAFVSGTWFSQHVCGTISDSNESEVQLVVVAGGGYSPSDAQDIFQYFLVGSSEWNAGPVVPEPIMNGAGTTTPDGLRLIIAGGSTGPWYGSIRSTIFQIQCHSLDCHWSKLDQELETARRGAVAMFIPESFTFCS